MKMPEALLTTSPFLDANTAIDIYFIFFFREKKKPIKIHEDRKVSISQDQLRKYFEKSAQIRRCQSVIFRCVAERRSVRSYFIFGKTHFRADDDINYYD